MTHLFSARTVRLTAALFGAASFCFARSASAQYTLTPIVSTNAQFTKFVGAPSLDADGSVAFQAYSPISYTSYEQYQNQGFFLLSPGGSATLVAGYGDHITSVGPLSYRSGRLAYSYDPYTTGPYLLGPRGEYAHAEGLNGFQFFGSFSLSPDGIVAFSASGSDQGIYWSDGTQGPDTNMPFQNSDSRYFIAPGTGTELVRINRSHQVAIVGASVQRGDTFGGPVLTLADTGGMFQSFTGGALSDNGDVTFSAALKAGGIGIFRANAGGVSTLVSTNTLFASFVTVCSNNSGQIAFEATLPSGAPGVYTGPDNIKNKIVSTGMKLGGKIIANLAFGPEGLNDRGQIAFQVAFTDGSQALYLASPPLISGNVTPEGAGELSQTLAPLGSVTVQFRTSGTQNVVSSATSALIAAFGASALSYSIPPPPPGIYDVAIKSDKSLQILQPNVTINGTGTIPDAFLPAGDATNDNRVDSADFGLLIGAFNGDVTIPGSGYDSRVDFDYDGVVDSTDFGLLIGEYGNQGAL